MQLWWCECGEPVSSALATFTPLWDALTYQEQAQLAALLIDRVDWDGEAVELAIREGTNA